MRVDYTVPFYANTLDNTHCYQAALRMVLKYFEPEKDFSWEDLDTMTAKVKDLWTWPMAGLLWLKAHGYAVVFIEGFDHAAFAKEGEKYLLRAMGEEVGREQIKHSDIAQERKYALELLKKVTVEKRLPKTAELRRFLEDGYLLICNVNSKKLNDKDRYVGHFVVLKGIDGNELILHDPGLPPQENRRVPLKKFEAAWAYPNTKAKNIMAFRFLDASRRHSLHRVST